MFENLMFIENTNKYEIQRRPITMQRLYDTKVGEEILPPDRVNQSTDELCYEKIIKTRHDEKACAIHCILLTNTTSDKYPNGEIEVNEYLFKYRHDENGVTIL